MQGREETLQLTLPRGPEQLADLRHRVLPFRPAPPVFPGREVHPGPNGGGLRLRLGRARALPVMEMVGHTGLACNFDPRVNASQPHALLGRRARRRKPQRSSAPTPIATATPFMAPALLIIVFRLSLNER